ncbi:MAG: type II toxin-antitoxin system HicA family toxin [Methanosarcinales archaeon]|nr:type II toxin-antitoxin system HicA family toxin [Methanosarcinales archaeon]
MQKTGEFQLSRLKGIKGNDTIKAFIKAGGVGRKGKGDHVNVKMPNGQIITIPGSKEIKIGLLKAAIKKAGLTEEEFIKLLK